MEELDLICLELARRERDERIRYFSPNGGQQRFIDEISRDGAFIVVNGSGNGGGKTFVLIALTAAIMWPSLAPKCFGADIFQKWPYPKRLRICSTPKELEEIGSIQTTIKELFPVGKYESVKKGKHFPSQFISDTGFVLDLFSYEQDPGEMAGPSLGMVAFNEPPPENLWKEAIIRTRKGGIIPVAMTSLNTNPWIVDGLINKANGKDIRVIFSDIEENCKQHGVGGTLEHDQIEKILSQYDPDEREARKTGRPLSMSGRIYKTFNELVHVSADEFDPPEDQPISIGMIVDPAIGKPLAILWRYVDKAGVVHYFDEYPDFQFEGAKDGNLTVHDYANLIRDREKGRRVDIRILDRHFGNVRRTLGGMTLKEEFAEAGEKMGYALDFTDSYSLPGDEVETGILKVKEYLRYDQTKPVDALNRPKIRISPRCKNTIAAFKMWGRNPKTGKPKEEFKDFMDLVRYDLMSNPAVESESTWISGRKPYYGVNS